MPPRLNTGLPLRLMARAKGFDQFAHSNLDAFRKALRVNNLTAYFAMHKPVGYNLIPAVLEHVLEFYGMLGTHAPARGTARAPSHVVEQRLNPVCLAGIERPRRAVLDAGQASIALFIHVKVDHCSCLSIGRGQFFEKLAPQQFLFPM